MQENPQRILVLGLPETGKSSYVQAVDEVLKHPRAKDALCSEGLANDRSYIQEGKESFLAGQKLQRTDRQLTDTFVELWFRHPPTGLRGRLHLPDEKGEMFRDQWIHRRWEKAYADSLRDIVGALVFVRADEKSRNDERLGVLAKEITVGQEERPFEMREASAQVQLLDVLQFIVEQGSPPRPLRVAVLISAWDTVGGRGDVRPKEPGRFLAREWALIAQYLRANPEYFTSRIYGVSAYGGVPGDLGELAEIAAHERAQLIDGSEVTRDLTRPLRWLMQID